MRIFNRLIHSFHKDRLQPARAESGRTMVEMIGVIGLIGLISIIGIGGYNYALNSYRANTLKTEINMYAVDTSMQLKKRGSKVSSLQDLPTQTRSGYPMTIRDSDKSRFFIVEVGSIRPSVCSKIFSTGWPLVTAISLNGAPLTQDQIENGANIGDLCTDENAVALEFHVSLKPCAGDNCEISSETGDGGTTPEEPDNPEEPLPDGECPEGQVYYEGGLTAKCVDACPGNKVMGYEGNCYSCDNVVVDYAENIDSVCSKCGMNSFYSEEIDSYMCCPTSAGSNEEVNRLCGYGVEEEDEPCPGENEYRDLNTGECVEDSCPAGTFVIDRNGTCAPCPTEGNPISDAINSDVPDTCRKCSNAALTSSNDVDLWISNQLYCMYCPSPRVVCGTQCCAEGEKCQINFTGDPINSWWQYTYSCVSQGCQTDADCSGDKPRCNKETGQCMGCLTNADCNNGSETGDYFCNLYGTRSTLLSYGTCDPATPTHVISSPNDYSSVNDQSYTYVISGNLLTWWGGENFCKAHGMSLAPIYDFCDENTEYGNTVSTSSYVPDGDGKLLTCWETGIIPFCAGNGCRTGTRRGQGSNYVIGQYTQVIQLAEPHPVICR